MVRSDHHDSSHRWVRLIIVVLQIIYGDNAIHLYHSSPKSSGSNAGAARNALELGGFLEQTEELKDGGRTAGKGRKR